MSETSNSEKRDLSRPIVIVGALPPPLSGYSLITAKVLELARGNRKVICFDISPRRAERNLRYHVTRIARVGLAMIRLLPVRLSGARELYLATESRAGLVYTIALSAVARLLGFELFLHHHVFSYITQRNRLMEYLVRLTRNGATHIFLCECMERDFAKLYKGPFNSIRLANAAFVEPPQKYLPSLRPDDEPLRVGLLSNLTREKGLYDFLALAEAAAAQGSKARFLLAGPAQSPRDAEAIALLRDKLPETFEYRGPVYEAEKDLFYREIDVFAFPTTYENEAQPLVLYEAMSYGCAVVAFDRGCIAEQVGKNGLIIAHGETFVARALPKIEAWQRDRRDLLVLQTRAALDHADENARTKRAAQRMLGVAKDARSARQLLTGGQALYDVARWAGGGVLERFSGSPFLSDAYADLIIDTVDLVRSPASFSAPVLHSILARQFPEAFRKSGVAFIHIPKNAGTSVNYALYGRSFGHMTAAFLHNVDAQAFAEVESLAVLRDPVERTVSAYFHALSGGGSEVRMHPLWAKRLSRIGSFDAYLTYLEENQSRLARLEYVCRPQSHFVCDRTGRLIVGKLFVLRTDDEALAEFVAARGKHRLPRRNWTPHELLEITAAQRERIRSIYAADFRLIDAVLQARA